MIRTTFEFGALERGRQLMANYPRRLSAALKTAMRNSVAEVLLRLKGYVPVRTGNLRRSWVAREIEQMPDGVGWKGGIGSNADYAAAVEFGKDMLESVRGHVRKVKSRNVYTRERVQISSSLFDRSRDTYKTRRTLASQGIAFVHAHYRQARQKPRPYLRPGLSDAQTAFIRFHEMAVNAAWTKVYGGGGDAA